MSSIMDIIGPEHLELFALELTIRSGMSYTIDLVRIEHLQLSALELEKLQ